MTRRDFLLSTTAAAALLPRVPTSAAPGGAGPVPAIDTHIHLYDPTRPQGVPWPSPADPLIYRPHLPAHFASLGAPHHIVGAVVVECSPWLEDNQWILDLAKDHAVIVGLVGHLEPGKPGFAAHLRRFATDPIFRGIRLGAAAIKDVRPGALVDDLRRLSERGLTLDLLGKAGMLPDLVRLAPLVPDLPLIIDHLPFKDWDGNPVALRNAWSPIAALPNVFVKLSEVVRRVDGQVITDPAFYRPGLDVLRDLFGPDRVLFASNWPVSDHVAPYATVHRVVSDYFTAQGRVAAEKYFWRNSTAVYRWQRRGAAAALGS